MEYINSNSDFNNIILWLFAKIKNKYNTIFYLTMSKFWV